VPRRAVALLLTGPLPAGGCPPGVAPDGFARALVEDVADLISDLPGIDPVVAYTAEHREVADTVTWPGTTLLEVAPGGGPLPVLAALGQRGYDEGAVIAADVPDLPDLLVAKVFSGLAGAQVAVVPAVPAGQAHRAGGDPSSVATDGLVLLGSRLPAPAWLAAAVADLDVTDAVDRLRRAAPAPGDLVVARAWRRLRAPADLAGLDPGLEGWEATRALLSGR
jgi:hypothetical protein